MSRDDISARGGPGRNWLFALLALVIASGPAGLVHAQEFNRPNPIKVEGPSPLDKAIKRVKRQGSPRERIIGGIVAPAESFLFQVSLLYSNTTPGHEIEGHFCGGTLIGKVWVLTAAHCVSHRDGKVSDPAEINVYVGSDDFKGGERIQVEAIYRNPNYVAEYLDNDIALLRLVHAPRVRYRTIDLATSKDAATYMAAGTQATIIGWGSTEESDVSRRLQEAAIQVMNRAQCNNNLLAKRVHDLQGELANIAEDFRISAKNLGAVKNAILQHAGPLVTNSMFCAGDPTVRPGQTAVRDACQGDSGGPIFVAKGDGHWLQIGIISWGEGCGIAKLYGVYTRVANFSDWIKTVMEQEISVAK